MTSMENKDCAICCETLNNSTRKRVPCVTNNCDIAYCKSCVRTYLLGNNKEPHCMKCKSAWGQEHLVKHLNRSFCNKEYKEHRKSVLVDIEMSKMPETMNAANRQKEINKIRKRHAEHQKEIANLTQLLNEFKKTSREMVTRIANLESGRASIPKKKFIMPCSVSNCRGFLSSAYKCEICETYTCSDCLCPIGETRNNEQHTCNPNELENAKYIKDTCKACPGMCGEFIYKIDGCDQMWCTTCHTAFSWRTGEIERGVIHNPHYYQAMQNGVGVAPRAPGDVVCGGLPDIYYAISNPYKKFMRQLILLKTPEFNTCNFKNVKEIWLKIKELSTFEHDHEFCDVKEKLQIDNKDMVVMAQYLYYYVQIELVHKEICNLHLLINHINQVTLLDVRTKIALLENNEPVRVDYILNIITKEKLAEEVYRKEQIKQKLQEELYILELLSACGIDLFRFILDSIESIRQLFPLLSSGNLNTSSEALSQYPELSQVTNIFDRITVKMNEFKALCNYCNKEFAKISTIFNKVSFHIQRDHPTRKIIGTDRHSRNLILRNLFVNDDLPIVMAINHVSICYAFMVKNNIIKTEPRYTNRLLFDIEMNHFTFDSFVFTTGKFKKPEDCKEESFRKPHRIQYT